MFQAKPRNGGQKKMSEDFKPDKKTTTTLKKKLTSLESVSKQQFGSISDKKSQLAGIQAHMLTEKEKANTHETKIANLTFESEQKSIKIDELNSQLASAYAHIREEKEKANKNDTKIAEQKSGIVAELNAQLATLNAQHKHMLDTLRIRMGNVNKLNNENTSLKKEIKKLTAKKIKEKKRQEKAKKINFPSNQLKPTLVQTDKPPIPVLKIKLPTFSQQTISVKPAVVKKPYSSSSAGCSNTQKLSEMVTLNLTSEEPKGGKKSQTVVVAEV